MAPNFSFASPKPSASRPVSTRSTLQVWEMKFAQETSLDRDRFLADWRSTVDSFSKFLTAEFQVTSIRTNPPTPASSAPPTSLETRVRFELVGTGPSFHREQRIGNWKLEWSVLPTGELRLQKWRTLDETRSRSLIPFFADITQQAFAGNSALAAQLAHGSDYWRTILDGACGIDIYGHNGVSIADIDGDGFDDLYVCQPSGLPNRLFRNRGDGTFEDITESSGLGLLENSACALFADINNNGRQDAIIVRTAGPLLYLNEGGGKFRLKPDAFNFANPPQGAFTGAAIADYDRDGWLDIYFCLYTYYQGADQYRYPTPYYDAENGPPNFMMRNNRDATFRDVTRESHLDKNNTRFSFCSGWNDFNNDGWPDLYVANDFGRKNLYRNNGDGTFTDIAPESAVEDIGAGMSVSWLDYDNDGKQDLYVADMWTAAGIRISQQDIFQPHASEKIRALYRKHAMGNSLFQNRGNANFEDATARSGSAIGRWSWSSDAWDFDHDGFADLYIANGMISGPTHEDLNGFFWRQVVANSPQDAKPDDAYEQGWNAINELIRSDATWSGFERNIFYLNNRDGTFSDVSAVVGLDFIEDSRTFALADFDQDGRVEVFLKNRNAPQLRLLKNIAPELSPAIAFRLTGKKSNRDAIGAAVTVETGSLRQTLFLQAGTGFLEQHTKELFFGLGDTKTSVAASIRWPSGLIQTLDDLPLNHRIWIEEGSSSSRVEPFKTPRSLTAAASAAAAVPPESENLPKSAETWLLAPVTAPDFSLPNLAGRPETLSARRGKPVLLHFFSAASQNSQADLAEFDKLSSHWASESLQLVAINVDDPASPANATLPQYRNLSFPILRATSDIIAIYNILYRYLFDRHRDLSLPTSFLLDEKGAIVKIYQGQFPKQRLAQDIRQIPRTPTERLAKALPFSGVIDSPEFTRNYLSLGSVVYERGYLDQSESFFDLARQDDTSAAEPYYGLGSVYLQQQKIPQARASFERAVQLHANFPGTLPKAWNNLGIVAAREGRAEDAMQNFQRALELDPTYVVALENLGSAYRQQKRWDDAKRVLERALELSPNDPGANYGLGMIYAQLNDTDRAYEYLQKALAARPDYPEALNNLGVLYLRTNRRAEAEKTFQESIRVAPAYDQSYLNLSRLYALEGENEKARAVLLALLKQNPTHAQAQKDLDQLTH
jgi:tetratricopeptide (TPR) repeat protein